MSGEEHSAVLVAALTTLTRIAEGCPASRDAVRVHGGVHLIVGILEACSNKADIAAEAAACLGALATDNVENQVGASLCRGIRFRRTAECV